MGVLRGGAAALSLAVALGAAGCGNNKEDQAMATVSGSCALLKDKYSLSPIPATLLAQTLGDGEYVLSGDVSADDKGVARDGSCNYVGPADDAVVRRLTVSVSQNGLPGSGFQEAQQILRSDGSATKIDDGQGYVLVSRAEAVGGGQGDAAVAVLFSGDRIVRAEIVVPLHGVDGTEAATKLVRAASDAFSKPLAQS